MAPLKPTGAPESKLSASWQIHASGPTPIHRAAQPGPRLAENQGNLTPTCAVPRRDAFPRASLTIACSLRVTTTLRMPSGNGRSSASRHGGRSDATAADATAITPKPKTR